MGMWVTTGNISRLLAKLDWKFGDVGLGRVRAHPARVQRFQRHAETASNCAVVSSLAGRAECKRFSNRIILVRFSTLAAFTAERRDRQFIRCR